MVTRIQRKRTKGFTLPPNTLYAGRPGRWGNPYPTAQEYRERAIPHVPLKGIEELREYDYIACWCSLDADCHADALVELANS